MSIESWTATFEPYAEDVVVDGTGGAATITTTRGQTRIAVQLQNALSWWGFDDNIQKVWLQKASDPDQQIECASVQALGATSLSLYIYDFGPIREIVSGTLESWAVFAARKINSSSADTRCYFDGLPSGANQWDLWIQWYPYWDAKNPLQIAFSCFAYQMRKGDTKGWLDQATWQALNDYYTDAEFECFMLPKGRSVGEIAREAMKHTTDFLAIRPDNSNGAVTLHAIGRRFAVERFTVIDLDDPLSRVSEWEATIRLDLTVRHIKARYGDGYFFQHSTDRLKDYQQFPLDMPNGTDLFESRCDTHASQEFVHEFEAPIIMARKDLALHFDPSMWRDEQLEIKLTMGPLHWNYEVGDLVRVKSAELGLTGTGDYEWFIVTHKKPNFRKHTARLTLLRVYGTRGLPAHAYYPVTVQPDRLFCFTTATVGDRPDAQAINDEQRRNWDRWENEFPRVIRSDDPYHGIEDTSTGALSVEDSPTRGRWPYIEDGNFDLSRASSSRDVASFLNYSAGYFYFIYVGYLDTGTADHVILSFGDAGSIVKFGRTSSQPSKAYGYYTNTDGWKYATLSSIVATQPYVLTIALGHGGGSDGRIGLNGVWQSSGLAYTATSLDSAGLLGDDTEAHRNWLLPTYAAILFGDNITSTLPELSDGIEEWLMERYRKELKL